MKKIIPILLAGSIICVVACKEEQPRKEIITKMAPKETVTKGPKRMHENASQPRVVDWVTGKYTITVVPHSDPDLPLSRDESGQEYYDNKIDLKVTRADGSVFFSRTFSKADFSSLLDEKTFRDGAMLGLPFIRVEDSQLVFGASIGSPDESSDEYVPFILTISRMGEVRIERDTQLEDTDDKTENNKEEDEGV